MIGSYQSVIPERAPTKHIMKKKFFIRAQLVLSLSLKINHFVQLEVEIKKDVTKGKTPRSKENDKGE